MFHESISHIFFHYFLNLFEQFNNSHAVPPLYSLHQCHHSAISSCNFPRFKPAHQIYSGYVSNCKFCRKKVINIVRWLGPFLDWSIEGTSFKNSYCFHFLWRICPHLIALLLGSFHSSIFNLHFYLSFLNIFVAVFWILKTWNIPFIFIRLYQIPLLKPTTQILLQQVRSAVPKTEGWGGGREYHVIMVEFKR